MADDFLTSILLSGNNAASGGNSAYSAPMDNSLLISTIEQRRKEEEGRNYSAWSEGFRVRVNQQEGLDPSVKREILAITDQNAAEAAFLSAQQNKGSYGVRNTNYAHLMLFNDRPGAAQLFSSSQSRVSAQKGLLSAPTATSLLGG